MTDPNLSRALPWVTPTCRSVDCRGAGVPALDQDPRCPDCGAALEDDVCDRCDGPQDDSHLKFGERYEHKEDYP